MPPAATNDLLAWVSSQARTISAEWARVWNHSTAVGPMEQLRSQAIVVAAVAAALVVRYAFGASDVSATFLVYPMVVAWAARRGGWPSGVVATLASAVAIRLVEHPTAMVMALFLIESLGIIAIVQNVTAQLSDRVSTLDLANRQLGDLQRADQRARSLEMSVRLLEALTPEHAIVLLDRQGAIVEWRVGAQRLYGFASDVLRGRSVSVLFPEGDADPACRALFADTERGAAVHRTVWQRRSDGHCFEADVHLTRTTAVGGEGFAMVVCDRTLERERQLKAEAAADAHRALQDEADVAHRQLATLQAVTDPSLNEWAPPHLISELLERLRGVIHADGVALVIVRGVGAPRVYSTPDGLHPGGLSERASPDLSRHAMSRVVFVQNDPARVAEQSFLRWPEGTTSLIAVPLVHAGEVEGTIEVVDRRGRRSTEWEIALMQVVSARVVGLARDPGEHRHAESTPAAGAERRAQRTA